MSRKQLENQVYSPEVMDDIGLFISAQESTNIDEDIEIASVACRINSFPNIIAQISCSFRRKNWYRKARDTHTFFTLSRMGLSYVTVINKLKITMA